MCGIAGEIRFGENAETKNVELMLTSLRDRGPDGSGLFAQQNICLGHQRLRVIDLSNQGNQPMHDAELGLTLVFNGCIYNYKALRSDLELQGFHFFSTSDSEVVLKAYALWGDACVHKFAGMFAFAIWDRDTGETFFARDRLGIKPLYYYRNTQGFWFASTLPALLKSPFVPTTINPAALHQYMSFRAIVESNTLFKDVQKLRPGHWMKLSDSGDVTEQQYWKLQSTVGEQEHSEAEWKALLKESLYTSVKRRLEADVPVGVLLSGGLDSSLLVGIMSDLGQKDIHTFSIGFDNVDDEQGDEFQYSDIIAERYATKHSKIHVQHEMLLSHLKSCIKAMSEPMVSHDTIGFYLLSEAVSQHVKVVQSGQGADEVFGGYHWYPPMVNTDLDNAAKTYADAYFSWDDKELNQVLAPAYQRSHLAFQYVSDYFSHCDATRPIDKALHLDTASMLVDDPVKRVDNMTMAFGLEARVPFLDHELVELAFSMPHELKLRDGGKYILKEVARDIIPHQVIDRPKGYFPVPALRKMQGEYLILAKNVFKQPEARNRGLFNMDYIDAMLEDPSQYTGPFGSKLWQVTLLELWLHEHNIELSHEG
ncbi:MAG: N-acetylglutaminylglutamine amidotransferase [Pseudomonadota bacterium]